MSSYLLGYNARHFSRFQFKELDFLNCLIPGGALWPNGFQEESVFFLKGGTSSFNMWIHLLRNIPKDYSLRHHSLLHSLAIRADAFDDKRAAI